MIEGSDINDKEILDTSRKETNANGTFRFKITLPNGRDMVSEWLNPEHGRKAMKLWCDAVREAWPEAAKEKAREKGAAARKAAAAARKAELDKIVDSIDPRPCAPNQPTSREQDRGCAPVDTAADPCEHAKNQVALLEAEERHWLAEFQRAEKHLATTRDRLRKWKLIVASFDAGESK